MFVKITNENHTTFQISPPMFRLFLKIQRPGEETLSSHRLSLSSQDFPALENETFIISGISESQETVAPESL